MQKKFLILDLKDNTKKSNEFDIWPIGRETITLSKPR